MNMTNQKTDIAEKMFHIQKIADIGNKLCRKNSINLRQKDLTKELNCCIFVENK
jgi:hypothetical protein